MTHFDDAAIAADYDDMKVDEFSTVMKSKMAKKRDEGRGGWDDPAQCTVERLAGLLLSHIAKGDPVDIANFCMMLFHRNGSEAIQQAARDHYAPKLTENEAIDIVAKDLALDGTYTEKSFPHRAGIAAVTALRAASMRFRDDA
jgi:hypothetical protein